MAPQVPGGELAARALGDAGVAIVFALPGGHIHGLLRAAERTGPRVILTRHEEAAVLAAEGYALATGDVGVAAVTAGPGFTNALPGMAEAHLAGVPVVVLAGRTAVSQRGRGAVQDLDQLRVVSGITKWSAECLETARIPEYVEEAVYQARTGSPGVAYLEIPEDVLAAHCDIGPDPRGGGHRSPGRPVPAAGDVVAAVRLLEQAERPVALAGSGAFFSRAGTPLAAFIERTGIPLVTTSAARGLVSDDHPRCVGGLVHGGVALASADVALVLGSRFNANVMYGGPPLFPPEQKVIQIDVTQENLGGMRAPDLALTGDVGATVSVLTESWQMDATHWDQWQSLAHEAAATSVASWHEDAGSPSSGIHPGALAIEVAAFAAEQDATFVADGGDSSIWGLAMAGASRPGSLLYIGSALGTLGIGLPFALGARAAHPQHPAVLFTGDGAFGLTAMELDTAARYGLPVLIVVVDNGGWSEDSHAPVSPPADGAEPASARSRMRYDLLAEAVGGHGERVDEAGDVGGALRRAALAVREGRPAVVDVVCDPAAVSSFMRGMGGLGLM